VGLRKAGFSLIIGKGIGVTDTQTARSTSTWANSHHTKGRYRLGGEIRGEGGGGEERRGDKKEKRGEGGKRERRKGVGGGKDR